MTEGCRTAGPPRPSERTVAISDDTFEVDAALIGELLHMEPARVPVLMREGAITSASERGLDAHAGEFRLTFFYGNRRARLTTDMTGRVIRRSAVDIAERPGPAAKPR
jgi:hypothetical protein